MNDMEEFSAIIAEELRKELDKEILTKLSIMACEQEIQKQCEIYDTILSACETFNDSEFISTVMKLKVSCDGILDLGVIDLVRFSLAENQNQFEDLLKTLSEEDQFTYNMLFT